MKLSTKIAATTYSMDEDEVKKFDPMTILAIVQILAQLVPMLQDCFPSEEPAKAIKKLARQPLRRIFYRRVLNSLIRQNFDQPEFGFTVTLTNSFLHYASASPEEEIEQELKEATEMAAANFIGFEP